MNNFDEIRQAATFKAIGSPLFLIFQLRGGWWEYLDYEGVFYNIWLYFYDNSFVILHSFIISSLSISFLFFKKSRKIANIVLFLFLLIFILFASGSSFIPEIYLWFYRNVPFFYIFREPFAKFMPLVLFLMVTLFSISLDNIYEKFRNRNHKNFFIVCVFFLVSIGGIPLFSYNFFDRTNEGWKKNLIKLPYYWYEYSSWSKSTKDSFILPFPFMTEGYDLNYKWYDENLGNSNAKIYHLFGNSNYIGDYYNKIAPYSKILQAFVDKKNFNFIKLGTIDYLLDQNDIDKTRVEALIKWESGIKKYFQEDYFKNFGDKLFIYKIKDEYFLPRFYIPQNIIYARGNIESLVDIVGLDNYEMRSAIYLSDTPGNSDKKLAALNWADEVFVRGKLENMIGGEELTIVPREIELPDVRWSPNQLIYPLILKEEEYDSWKVRKEPEKLFEKDLFYASKRIVEMKRFADSIDEERIIRLAERYRREMIDALEILISLKESKNKNFPRFLANFEGSLREHGVKIEEIGRLRDWEDVFKELEERANGLEVKRDFSQLVYNLNVPKEGNYGVFLRSESIERGVKNVNTAGWMNLGEEYFKKGAQELFLTIKGVSENLVDENLRIKGYLPNSIYRISFDYKAPLGGSFFVAEGEAGEVAKTYLSPTNEEFRHFEMFFKSSSEAEIAFAHLSISTAQEKDLAIERIFQPEVILRLKDIGNQALDTRKAIPKITFAKINPTKYRVKVEGAVNPYTLIFSESFHEGWKVYIDKTQNSKLKTQNDYGQVVASYFDGEIKEGTHKNIFFDRNTFETLRSKPISEERHLLVNGYANSWYITPADVDGRENYEIIVEFRPQRLFYIGLFISGMTLVACFGCLGYPFIKDKWLRRKIN
ncbi:MAG TPA: hypothetical protein VMW41_05170 [Candidatus Bathyarchaeia archaeon]|nr:hypothetical protein [Candidatus Bathyarchaeia archaeon]